MSRSYRHLGEYEKIMELKAKGLTKREIGERLGFSFKQIDNFITRYNTKQRKLEAGITLRAKGKPPKDCEITEELHKTGYTINHKTVQKLILHAQFCICFP